ncbi:hypothetical protein LguiA_033387 [Lonicera macranthoides]
MENPQFLQYNNPQFSPEKPLAGDNFAVEDLLDFPNDDENDAFDTVVAGDSTVTAVHSCNSSFSGGEPHFSGNAGGRNLADSQFSGDLCVPHEDLAELEWLSNFVEESFSSEDLHKMQLISGMKARTQDASDKIQTTPVFDPEMNVPAKARSKRSRVAPCKWTSRLLVLSPPTTPTTTTTTRVSSELDSDTSSTGKKTIKVSLKKKEQIEIAANINNGSDGGRRCLHCATDKTPQWRTGPLGPKTLCNACGVRYKSGRLVPEYRPASSPTFVLTKHSNSHRKVLELRRQKELQEAYQHQPQFFHPNMMLDLSNGDDYLIHQNVGPDYRQLI